MHKEKKRKIQRVWRWRILAGIGLCVGVGFAIVRVPGLVNGISAYRQTEKLNQVLNRGLERESELMDKLLVVVAQELERESGLMQVLEPELKRQLEQELDRGSGLMWVRVLDRESRLVLESYVVDKSGGFVHNFLVVQEPVQMRVLVRDGLILGLLTLVIGISLLFLLRLRNATSIPLTGQLICFIPEECVAELGVQHGRLIKRRIPIWKVRLMMLWCVLGLLWAFYIQINIENLGLPKIGGRGSIDE